jgi:hypothetical protein
MDKDRLAEMYAEKIVNEFPDSERKSLHAQAAMAAQGNPGEALVLAFDAGLYAGAERGYLDNGAAIEKLSEMLFETAQKLNGLVSMADNEELVRAIVAVRDPIAAWIASRADEAKDRIIALQVDTFELPEEFIRDTSVALAELPRAKLLYIGITNSSENPVVFAAWIVGRRVKMKCDCPGHLIEYLRRQHFNEISIEQFIRQRVEEEGEMAYVNFARYLVKQARDSVRHTEQTGEIWSAHGELSTDTAQSMQDLLAKIAGRGNSDESER